jgi:hypothetical protein
MRPTARLPVLAAIILLLAGCASRQSRIEQALIDAGLPPPAARCIAPDLDRDLSDRQLKEMGAVVRQFGRYPSAADRAAILLGSRIDIATVATVGRAFARCAPGLGRGAAIRAP